MRYHRDAEQVPHFASSEVENDKVEKVQTFTRSGVESDSTRVVEGQQPSTLTSRAHGDKTGNWTAKQTSDATTMPATLPTSWFEDSGSQSSCNCPTPEGVPKTQIRVVPPSPGVLADNERDMDGHVKPAQSVAASLSSVQNSIQNLSASTATTKADRIGTASRVEARLRNGVDKFLLRIRPSRRSLLQDNPSCRGPLTLSPQELDAYLALPTDAFRPVSATKMTPRSPTGDKHERILTSRHSAPLLRGNE